MNTNDSYYIYLAKTALRRAGFFNKNTDNKITKDYETALRAFQRANGITETGTADKETKEFLKPYLFFHM